jgi:ubiquinone/menaquinone biosynthesis C-methylase UbiE
MTEIKRELNNFYRFQVQKWGRNRHRWITDFMAREMVFSWCKESASGKNVLDLGCGEGYFSRMVAQYAHSVLGIDLSDSMVDLAERQTASFQNVSFLRGDVCELQEYIEQESFDICVSNFVLNNIPSELDIQRFFSSIFFVLRRRGKFCVSFPHPCFMLYNADNEYIHYDSDDSFDYFVDRNNLFRGYASLVNNEGIYNERVDFINFHHTLSDVLNSIFKAGLHVVEICEPSPMDVLPKEIFNLSKIKNVPYYLLIFGEKR